MIFFVYGLQMPKRINRNANFNLVMGPSKFIRIKDYRRSDVENDEVSGTSAESHLPMTLLITLDVFLTPIFPNNLCSLGTVGLESTWSTIFTSHIPSG